MNRFVPSIALVLLTAGWGFSGFEPLSLSVRMENGTPVVEWAAESEDDVEHYEVEVETQFSDGQARIVQFEPHGAKRLYVFRDDELFKGAETVTYTVFAVLTTSERVQVGPEQQVNYTPTAVRRTWGSIKAMFQ